MSQLSYVVGSCRAGSFLNLTLTKLNNKRCQDRVSVYFDFYPDDTHEKIQQCKDWCIQRALDNENCFIEISNSGGCSQCVAGTDGIIDLTDYNGEFYSVYRPFAGCLECPDGKYSTQDSVLACDDCTYGIVDATRTSCTCNEGYYFDETTRSCTSCDMGTYKFDIANHLS